MRKVWPQLHDGDDCWTLDNLMGVTLLGGWRETDLAVFWLRERGECCVCLAAIQEAVKRRAK